MNNNLSPDKPTCVAIVICNEIIEDKRTSNKSLISLFNSITVAALPAMHPRLFLMVSLTNLRGDIPITFQIKSPSEKEIMRMDGMAGGGGDPLGVFDLVVEVLGLTVGEEGVHSVEVVSGDTLLGRRRFTVTRQATLGVPSQTIQ